MSVKNVYTAMAIMNIYRFPMEVFPLARTMWEEGCKSFSRIRDFLVLPEVFHVLDTGGGDDENVDNIFDEITTDGCDNCDAAGEVSVEDSGLLLLRDIHPNQEDELLVHIDNASFAHGNKRITDAEKNDNTNKSNASYETIGVESSQNDNMESPATELVNNNALPSSESIALWNVSFSIRRGELVAVVGSVGSGKTSLLTAMLKQMECVQGSQRLLGNVAYVSQEHWIQNKTLRDNVLFYNSFEEEKYILAIDASQLSNDLVMLPSADFTVIGERGINLSGGQKARVNIARAVYAKDDVDLIIFDDPLAAVDAHVGKAIFEDAILETLKDKARVVVFSSNYHFLSHFDKIIVVGQGEAGEESKQQQNSSIRIFTSFDSLTKEYPQYSCSNTADAEDSTNVDNAVDNSSVQLPSHEHQESDSVSLGAPEDVSDNMPGNKTLNYSTKKEVVIAPHESISIEKHLVPRDSKSIYRKIESSIQKKQEDGLQSDLVENEDREYGSVSINTITKYYAAAIKGKNGTFTLVVVLILFSFVQTIRVFSDLWIGIWAKDEEDDDSGQSTSFYLVVLSAFLFAIVFFTMCRSFHFLYACVGASANLHNSMLESILSASVNKYFDVTPIGRILNRFTKDMDAIDSLLPNYLLYSLQSGFHVLSILILCLASTPFFFVAFIPIAFLFYLIQKHFRLTSRELKRLDGVSRSPIYNHLAETLGGLSTIRAYGKQDVFLKINHRLSNDNKRCFFAFAICNRWLSLRLDTISSAVVLLVSFIAVAMVNMGSSVDENVLALAIVYSIQLLDTLQWTARVIIETENNLTSVERLLAFDNIAKESKPLPSADNIVPKNWPSQGSVRISDLSLRYRDGLPLVLKSVSLEVPGGCKLGICGRTGSGKR